MVYNYFRTYDPSTGRYLESDPIGLLAGPNTYAYVFGNPLKFIDRYGLCSCRAVGSDGFGDKEHTSWDVWNGFLGSRHIVECAYECESDSGKKATVTAKHKEWYFSSQRWDDGREGTCLQAFFSHMYNPNTNKTIYSTLGFGSFDPRKKDSRGWRSSDLEKWAEDNCDDCEK